MQYECKSDYEWRVMRLNKKSTANRLNHIQDKYKPIPFVDYISHHWVEPSDLKAFDWTRNVWWPDELIFSSCGGQGEIEECAIADTEWQRFIVTKLRTC